MKPVKVEEESSFFFKNIFGYLHPMTTESSSIFPSSVPQRLSYWLVPSEPALSRYQTLVSGFASRFGGPNFIPHVTIYFGAFHPDDPVAEIVSRLAAFKELRLKPQAIYFSEKFTTSAYIKFEDSSELAERCEYVQSAIRLPEAFITNPHMSLFYGALSEEQRKEILSKASLEEEMRFNVVKAIANPPQVVSREDVEAWWEVSSARAL